MDIFSSSFSSRMVPYTFPTHPISKIFTKARTFSLKFNSKGPLVPCSSRGCLSLTNPRPSRLRGFNHFCAGMLRIVYLEIRGSSVRGKTKRNEILNSSREFGKRSECQSVSALNQATSKANLILFWCYEIHLIGIHFISLLYVTKFS